MKKTLVLAMALLLPGPAARPAEALNPSVLLLEISPRPDAEWRDKHLRLMERLRRALDQRPSLRLVPERELGALLQELPQEAVEPLAQRALEHLRRGKEYSRLLRPQEAISEFNEAGRIFRAVFASLGNLSYLEEVHLQMGMTHQALGRDRQAAHEYRMVLLLNPERELDETLVNPVVVESFNRERERLLTSMRGSISLVSRPHGARVLMNGRPAGYTPLTISGVFPGEHYFSMESDGYKIWFGVLAVKPGELEEKEIFLTAGRGIHLVRLRERIGRAGVGSARAEDVSEFAQGVGADWTVLVSLSHLDATTMIELGIFESGGKGIDPLGVFPVAEDTPGQVAGQVERWIAGDRQLPHRTFVRRMKSGDGVSAHGQFPPPDPPRPTRDGAAWYRQWWFWAAVGVVAAGATATVLWLSPHSGIRVEAFR